MSPTARSSVVSSFTLIKGAMIHETYEVLRAWDFSITKKENLDRLRRENFIGTRSATWLRDVAWVINRRFDPAGRDRALAVLAQRELPIEEWKPILLWHMTRDEFLLRDFLVNWLFPQFEAGVLKLRADELDGFLRGVESRGGVIEHEWADATLRRVNAGLLKAGVDFGLLRGTSVKEFASYHLPDRSFLYVLHAIAERQPSPARLIQDPDWRMYLMASDDVERELLRLHQFKQLAFEAAGTLLQLSLPYRTALEYAEAL